MNLNISEKKESHWIVLHYISNDIVEHFDSIGRKPDEHINNILFKQNLTYKYNNKSLFIQTCVDYFVYSTATRVLVMRTWYKY